MEKIIYSTKGSEYLAEEISQISKIEKGGISYIDFADGETEIQIDNTKSVRNKDVILIGATDSDKSHFELIDLLSAFKQDLHSRTVHLIIPYLGYSTAERSKTGNILSRGKYRVQTLFDAQPDMVTFLDLHAEGIKNFAGRKPVEHVRSEELVAETVLKLREKYDLILVSPDTGRGTWVKDLARKTNLPYEVMTKVRFGTDQVESAKASSQVQNKVAVLFDDMIRTGGTLIKSSESLIEAGASEVFSIATHAVLPGNSEERLQNSIISKLFVTNSHPRSKLIQASKFTVNSVASLLANII